MCERCQSKINVISRKTCAGCNHYFCQRCVSSLSPDSGMGGLLANVVGSLAASATGGSTSHRKSPQMCRRCTIFNFPVMERRHLNELSVQELKYYQGIDVPLNASKDHIIQLILGHQARVLTERAQKAIRQIRDDQLVDDVQSIDASTLQPPSTAYSSSGTRSDRSMSDSLSNSTADHQDTSTTIRSRVQKQIKLRKSTEVLNTSGIATIDDLSDESQIDILTVRQLKTILQRNCIDYRGCVEKGELMERVHRLYQDRLDKKEMEAKIIATGDRDAENEYLCKICMDSPVDCVFLNCGHMLTCVKCGRLLTECPVCRQYIVKVIHAFRV